MLDQAPALDTEIDTSDPIILSAEHITKVFPGTLALDDVSFNVRCGKVNVLIGENGQGIHLMKFLPVLSRRPVERSCWMGKKFTRVPHLKPPGSGLA